MTFIDDAWTVIQMPLAWIKWAKDQDLWDFITAGSGLLISAFVLGGQKKKIPEFSVHLTYSLGTGHKNYPNVLNIELRNLMDSLLVIGRPNFKFAKGIHAGRYAHGGNSSAKRRVRAKVGTGVGVISAD